jgi:aromatic-ring opening dioxygenase LigAB LigA subunit
MSKTHYFFPPASAYPLNRCLFLLKSDPAFRARFLADREAAMQELGLDAPARESLRAFERAGLIALGAHPYLVFMASLRVSMDQKPAAFEHF